MSPDALAQVEFRCLEARCCMDGVVIGFEADEPVLGINIFDSYAEASAARRAAAWAVEEMKRILG